MKNGIMTGKIEEFIGQTRAFLEPFLETISIVEKKKKIVAGAVFQNKSFKTKSLCRLQLQTVQVI